MANSIVDALLLVLIANSSVVFVALVSDGAPGIFSGPVDRLAVGLYADSCKATLRALTRKVYWVPNWRPVSVIGEPAGCQSSVATG